MSIISHLQEFRKRVVLAAAGIFLGSIGGWFSYGTLIKTLSKPVCGVENKIADCNTLYISGVLGPLNLQIKIALLVGVILSAPFWLYQLWAFVAPGLHKKEKKWSILFIIAATPFFATGVTLGYYILPVAIKVLLGFTPASLDNLIKFDDYLDFVVRIMLIFGLAFELPVFLVALNIAGALTGKAILKPWRASVFGIFLFTAAFTPTGDPITMLALAMPLCGLYFMAGGISILNDRRRNRKKSQSEEE
ncbi:MAG: twin-arginine translocase subunit TatC [Actinobacteria bacterium]|nr:twin-arginine translocase subunit TatC [Actinomycetota bacterium]